LNLATEVAIRRDAKKEDNEPSSLSIGAVLQHVHKKILKEMIRGDFNHRHRNAKQMS
jgi:hypothetical protein